MHKPVSMVNKGLSQSHSVDTTLCDKVCQ